MEKLSICNVWIWSVFRNTNTNFRYYIFDSYERLKIAEIGSVNLDPAIVKSSVNQFLLTFEKRELIYLDSYLKALSSSKIYIYELNFYVHVKAERHGNIRR